MCGCVGIFFLGTTCVGFFPWLVSSKPFQIPPTTDCQQRRSTRASILVHRTHRFRIVSYRIGILPRRHVQSILKLSAQIPTCRIHNMMCRFRDFASPYAQSRHTTPKGTHHNKTDSLGVRLIWVLLASRSAIATATRTWREQQKNEGCARFATKFRPSTVK